MLPGYEERHEDYVGRHAQHPECQDDSSFRGATGMALKLHRWTRAVDVLLDDAIAEVGAGHGGGGGVVDVVQVVEEEAGAQVTRTKTMKVTEL